MKRRNVLTLTLAAGSHVMAAAARAAPISGEPAPEMAPIDAFMSAFVQTWDIPGGQCAVAKDGRLVYARGFGTVDQAVPGAPSPQVVGPASQFRIASCSKPITAIAVMRLVERRLLGLEDRAVDILDDLTPPPGAVPDARLRTITVRHLLEHSGGFDSTVIDPQFDSLRRAADAFHHPRPATHTDIIRHAMGQPLAFTPGTKHVYSNFGYNVLGRVIERRTKLPYGEAIRALVLQPASVKRMALMTRTSPDARLPDEVFYADGSATLPSWPIYEDDVTPRPPSYGSFDGSAIDAHGGWIANAIDLTRILNAVGGASGPQLLTPETVAAMTARPDLPQWQGKDQFYALGWTVMPGRVAMTHNGALTFGTSSIVARLPEGVTFAILFNHLATDVAGMVTALQAQSVAAIGGVQSWPARDLYPTADG